jgi:rod shape-determining protein MreB
VIGIPLDVTEVERKAVEDATLGAGAGEVFLLEQPMAARLAPVCRFRNRPEI